MRARSYVSHIYIQELSVYLLTLFPYCSAQCFNLLQTTNIIDNMDDVSAGDDGPHLRVCPVEGCGRIILHMTCHLRTCHCMEKSDAPSMYVATFPPRLICKTPQRQRRLRKCAVCDTLLRRLDIHLRKTHAMSQVDAATMVSQEDAATMMSQEDAATMMSQEDAATMMSQEDAATMMSQEDTATMMSQEDAATMMSQENAATMMSQEDAATMMSQEDAATMMSQEDAATMLRTVKERHQQEVRRQRTVNLPLPQQQGRSVLSSGQR